MEKRDQLIADLRDQVEALEKIVRRRSDELRLIQKLACAKDRVMIGSILDGDSVYEVQLGSIDEYYSMGWFEEGTRFIPASVEETLEEVWQNGPRRPSKGKVAS